MKITIDEVTFNDKKVLSYLEVYLNKIENHARFNPAMRVKVFVNKDCDFTAFEAVDLPLQFTSSAHKLIETIKSDKILDYMCFKDFREKVAALIQEAQTDNA